MKGLKMGMLKKTAVVVVVRQRWWHDSGSCCSRANSLVQHCNSQCDRFCQHYTFPFFICICILSLLSSSSSSSCRVASTDTLTLSRHFSLSFIASGRSSGQHPVSSQSCCMYVRAGCPAFARIYVGVHRSTSLMSSSLLLQQCPACLVRLTWIVFVMEGRWPYSWCFVGCCLQDLFNIARSILV